MKTKKVLFLLPGIFAQTGKWGIYNNIYDQFKNLEDYEVYCPDFEWKSVSKNYHKYFIKFMESEIKPFLGTHEISFATSSFTGPLLVLLLNKEWNIKNVIMNCPTFSFSEPKCRRKYIQNNIKSKRYNFVNPSSYNSEIVKVFKKIKKIKIPSSVSIFINIGERDWLSRNHDISENVLANTKSMEIIPYANHLFLLPKSETEGLSESEIKKKSDELSRCLQKHNNKIINEYFYENN